MLQKTKSMLIKLLMLLCVVCCAVALAFGLAGCSGRTVESMKIVDGELIVYYSDGTEENLGAVGGSTETTVSIVGFDVSDDGSTITVTYSDGKTETFPLGDGEDDTCEHANMEYAVLSHVANWTCDMGGKVLGVCEDCGDAEIIDVAPGAHLYESTVVPPTCMSEGYTVDTCVYCKQESGVKTDITPATGEHHYAEEGFQVADKDSTICEGGWTVYPCEYGCGFVRFEELAPQGHDVDKITLIGKPTKDADGSATAFCNRCGTQLPVTLPALTQENLSKYTYEITEDEVNCSADMNAHFTYVDKETGLTVEFDGILPGGQHKLNGEAIDTTKVLSYSGPDSLPEGMEIAGNSNGVVNCTTEGVYAVFTCDDCGRIIVVNVRVDHTKPANAEVVTVTDSNPSDSQAAAALEANRNNVYTYAAACGTKEAGEEGAHTGYEVYYCSVCRQVVTVTLPVPAHTWTYEAKEGTDGGEKVLVVTQTCSICGEKKTTTLKDYTVTTVDATCQEEGSVTYTGTVDGKTVTIVKPITETFHVHATYGPMDDSKVWSVVDYSEIEISGNSVPNSCKDGDVQGVFYCTECDQPIVLQMAYPHTEPVGTDGKVVEVEKASIADAKTAAEADKTKVYVVDATCDTDGARIYYCTVCGELQEETIKATGHNWKATLTQDPTDKTWDYVVKCEKCGTVSADSVYDIPEDQVEVIGTTVSSCEEPATTTYRYTPEKGDPITVVVEGKKAMHTLNGDQIDDNPAIFYDPAEYEGITPSGNFPLTCDTPGGKGVFYCDVCGLPIVVSIRDAHNAPATISNTLPEGLTWESIEVKAASNGEIYEQEYDGANKATVEATLSKTVYYSQSASCTEGGKYIYYCSVCQNWICGVTEATGHNYSYQGYTWDEASHTFTLTFSCTNTGCTATATKIVLTPFKQDGNVLTLDKAYTLVSFTEPTHNTYGNFTVKYTVKAANFSNNEVAANFSLEVTLSGGLSRKTVGETGYHWHIVVPTDPVTPVDPDEPFDWNAVNNPEGNYYWFVDTTDPKTEVVTRTYYVAVECKDCGEIYVLEVKEVKGDEIPESDLPCYAWAVAADKAAEEETPSEEAPATEEAA